MRAALSKQCQVKQSGGGYNINQMYGAEDKERASTRAELLLQSASI